MKIYSTDIFKLLGCTKEMSGGWPRRQDLVSLCVCVCVYVCARTYAHMHALTQSCLTFCDPMDCSPPSASVHGILQARILEWVAIPFSRGLPDPGIKPEPLVLQADSLPSEPPGKVHAKRPHGLSKARLHPQEPKNLRC